MQSKTVVGVSELVDELLTIHERDILATFFKHGEVRLSVSIEIGPGPDMGKNSVDATLSFVTDRIKSGKKRLVSAENQEELEFFRTVKKGSGTIKGYGPKPPAGPPQTSMIE